jgi:hypothetical protein
VLDNCSLLFLSRSVNSRFRNMLLGAACNGHPRSDICNVPCRCYAVVT